jgi:hypothetical protein
MPILACELAIGSGRQLRAAGRHAAREGKEARRAEAYQKALAINQKLAAADPTIATRQRGLAIS